MLLNLEIPNSISLTNAKNIKKLKIIGCKLDNYDIISKIDKNIEFIYSKDEFFYVD